MMFHIVHELTVLKFGQMVYFSRTPLGEYRSTHTATFTKMYLEEIVIKSVEPDFPVIPGCVEGWFEPRDRWGWMEVGLTLVGEDRERHGPDTVARGMVLAELEVPQSGLHMGVYFRDGLPDAFTIVDGVWSVDD